MSRRSGIRGRSVHLPLAYRARDTVDFRRRSTPQFITADLNPVNYKIWSVMQERTSLQNSNQRHGQSETTADCRLVWFAAEYHR